MKILFVALLLTLSLFTLARPKAKPDDGDDNGEIRMSHKVISMIPSNVFKSTPQVLRADFSFDNISQIDQFAFVDAKNLKKLNLANNLIATLSDKIFTSLTELVELNVENNLLVNIETKTFANNKHLKKISLANNRLRHLDCGIFSSLINLEWLDLSKNDLQQFHMSCIASVEPFVLNISDNKLEQLTVKSNMISLNASGNQIGKIALTRGGLDKMEYFNISGSSVKNIAAIIRSLGAPIKTLDISYNFLGEIKAYLFSKLVNLEQLILRNASLSNIHFIFSDLCNLKTLDISYNNLNKIDFDGLKLNKMLESLFVDGNNLTEIGDILDSSTFPNLLTFSITENNFSCDWYKNWRDHVFLRDDLNLIADANCYKNGKSTQSTHSITSTTTDPQVSEQQSADITTEEPQLPNSVPSTTTESQVPQEQSTDSVPSSTTESQVNEEQSTDSVPSNTESQVNEEQSTELVPSSTTESQVSER